jgi:hypothetical protein
MYDSLSRLKAVENIPEGNLDIHRNGQETWFFSIFIRSILLLVEEIEN